MYFTFMLALWGLITYFHRAIPLIIDCCIKALPTKLICTRAKDCRSRRMTSNCTDVVTWPDGVVRPSGDPATFHWTLRQ
ncbi:hypothetical protein BDZ85DRAFT_41748 [Elsinoe ampelina]|uniref:Secreted protein n=1 Tax=Elsinoe ampelina TaxID=302913 RepID=A0A6A6G108_9PEZI|nr:hypothetical protein BDZ85DRAFT_41748 [Elsinoe ampelina]